MLRKILGNIGVACVIVLSGHSAFAATIDTLSQRISMPARRTPASLCELSNHGDTIVAFYSHIATGERYATLIDPSKCASSPQFPFEVRTVWIALYTFLGAVWPVNVDVEIWSVKGGAPCQGPGSLLYVENRTLDQATFSVPSVGKFNLAQSVCVDGPFFISLRYTGQSPAPYPSLMFDSRMPADSCVNWGFGPTTLWDNWRQFWSPPIPGNIVIWVDGETGSSTCSDTPCCTSLAGNVDCDPGSQVDISDLSAMIDYLYISFAPLCCTKEANVDGDPGIDISDLSRLIDYLYISFVPPAQCQ